ncbi:helix-turn-helix domain-containing protein [Lacrimispora sp.]|uniref:helix-turn-helix domain-containing protein n=1 Tax=Lacrimispora sp. TaxID=2719234 RepID=UPI0028AC3418|nr:helix-turn-helix transcriptional regulator [Lacrimispora sp.]
MIGKRIRTLREERNLSQEKLAAELGVSRMTVNNYENEKRAPDIDFAGHIANYFGVTVGYLMGATEYRYKQDEIISLKRAEKLFRIMEKLPQPEVQEMISSLIETLEKSVELDMTDEIVHVVNLLCVQVRRLLYSYENLKSDISVPVKKLKELSVSEENIRQVVHDKPRTVYDAAFQSIKQITQEVDCCAETMERRLKRLMEEKLKEPMNEEF